MNYGVFWDKIPQFETARPPSVLGLAVSMEYVAPKAAKRIYSRSQRLGADPVDVALGEGYLSEDDLCALQSIAFDCDEVDLTDTPPQRDLLGLLPIEDVLRYRLLPWRRDGEKIIYVTDAPQLFLSSLQARPYFNNFGDIVVSNRSGWQAALGALHGGALVQEAELSVPSHQSCRKLFSKGRISAYRLLGFFLMFCAAMVAYPIVVWSVLLALSLTSLVAMQSLKLCAFFSSIFQRDPTRLSLGPSDQTMKNPSFSILVPLLHEKEIAQTLVKRLMRLKYSKALLEVILVLEDEDQQTASVLENTDLPSHFRVIRVPKGDVTTKPRAMNYCLPFCKGDLIGIFDAEDAPDGQMLARVATHFRYAPSYVGCVQARLGFYNTQTNFLARCFTIEYATWYRHILPGLARLRLTVPLGGTSVFIKAELLRSLGAWDAYNVTEDADLGIRLARAGYRTEVIDVTTQEEANAYFLPWIKQRSRWLKGYIVTYLVHMSTPRRLLRDVGWRQFMGINVLFGGTIVQITLAPLLWSLWLILTPITHPIETAWPAFYLDILILFLGFSTLVDLTLGVWVVTGLRRWRLISTLPIMFIYLSFATFAIAKAWWEIIYKPFYWDKTQHGHSLLEEEIKGLRV